MYCASKGQNNKYDKFPTRLIYNVSEVYTPSPKKWNSGYATDSEHDRSGLLLKRMYRIAYIPYPIRSVGGVLISRRWINHLSPWRRANATPDLRLPSQLQDIAARDWCQIILLGDRGTCVWTTCPRLLPDSRTDGSWTRDLSSRKPMP